MWGGGGGGGGGSGRAVAVVTIAHCDTLWLLSRRFALANVQSGRSGVRRGQLPSTPPFVDELTTSIECEEARHDHEGESIRVGYAFGGIVALVGGASTTWSLSQVTTIAWIIGFLVFVTITGLAPSSNIEEKGFWLSPKDAGPMYSFFGMHGLIFATSGSLYGGLAAFGAAHIYDEMLRPRCRTWPE